MAVSKAAGWQHGEYAGVTHGGTAGMIRCLIRNRISTTNKPGLENQCFPRGIVLVAELRALFGVKNEPKQVQQHLCGQN